MEILSVSLKNFKSHQDRCFEFESGTNAICGENGAGKTSILEAIAWTLFAYSDYSKDDLVRKGAKTAQVTVQFISSLDGRTYQVQRCTRQGYKLYDPQLNQKLDCTKLDDVQCWLRSHMRLAADTDLPKLFAETIGIPQGSFTTDFLKRAGDRKKVFDPVLRVEEYRQAFSQSLDLENYAQSQVTQLEREIAIYDTRLQDWQELQQQQDRLQDKIKEESAELELLTVKLEEIQGLKDQLTATAEQIQQQRDQLQKLENEINRQEQAKNFLQQSLQTAQSAASLCESNLESYRAYQQAESVLQELDALGAAKQKLLREREGYQQRIIKSQAELTQLQLKLEKLQDDEVKIEQLRPAIAQQEALESQQKKIAAQLQQLQADRLEQQSLGKQVTKLQQKLQPLSGEIKHLQSLAPVIDRIPELERHRNRYREQLSRIEAAKQFEADLRQIVKSGEEKRDRYLAQAQKLLFMLHNGEQVKVIREILQMGASLHGEMLASLGQILQDISGQVSVPQLQRQLQALQGQLDRAYQSKAFFATLEGKQRESNQLRQEIQQLRDRILELNKSLKADSKLKTEQGEIEQHLQALNDPRSQSKLLAAQLQTAAAIRAKYDRLQEGDREIREKIARIDGELANFADLETGMSSQKQLQQLHRSGYWSYIKHEDRAKKLPTLEREFQEAIAQLETLSAQRVAAQAKQDQLAQSYNPQRLREIEQDYNTKRHRLAQLEGSLPPKGQQLTVLLAQLATRQQVASKRDRAKTELAERQKVNQFIRHSRQVYNQASPRITKYYLDEISREADRLFRELLDRQNVALEWTEDYEIMVQEAGYRRGFKSLSGGEQMCAALAVRLALLKILANIDVAFFDEPTTNMDRSRRRQLADAIANIKTFRQLFAISHDDTFENMSNIIHVQPHDPR
ncbi:MAG: SMC family ATPase [Hormoscilla sp. GUM202]|nr:SMC family ATPase [Hormoscilla sp. GUM202]